MASSHPAVVPPRQVPIAAGASSGTAYLAPQRQPAGFQLTDVTLTASYADVTRSSVVRVVNPGDIALPPLELDLWSDDPCQIPLVQNNAATIRIQNLAPLKAVGVTSYQWTVTGTTPSALDGETLVPPQLPAEGSEVRVSVVVTTAENLAAQGDLTLKVRGEPTLEESGLELRCRVNRLGNASHIGVPGERAREDLAQLRLRVAELGHQIAELL